MAFQYGMLMQLSMLLVLLLAATNAVVAATTTRSAREGGAEEHGKAGRLPEIAMAKPNCTDKCGNISIPYPFGIDDGCYFGPRFQITCDSGSTEPRLMESRMIVTNISLEEGELQTRQLVNRVCYDGQGKPNDTEDQSRGGLSVIPPYTISGAKNVLVAVGCDTYVRLVGSRGDQNYTTGCLSQCQNNITVNDIDKNDSCSGMGCCETRIPPLLNNLSLKVSSFRNHTSVWDFNPCGYAFVVENGNFTFSSSSFQQLHNASRLPLVLDWQIGEESCEFARQNNKTFACKGNSDCHNKTSGYICRCSPGFQGNPYLEDSCQDIDECALNSTLCENGKCINQVGNYTCSCDSGYENVDNKCIEVPSAKRLKIALGVSLGFSVLLVAIFWMYRKRRKRQVEKLKKKYFDANGGALFEKKMDSSGKKAKVFTEKDVKDTTNNYHERKKVGEGRYGIVYKGILDHQVVAIKKSTARAPIGRKQNTDPVDQNQITAHRQFLNEMTALYQINHKNVVRLIGGCLDTPTPILVYEFMSKGTLYENIHGKKGKKPSPPLKLSQRLRIAADTADALAYLHHSTAMHFIHREVKTANILLDKNFTAKLSGFGASVLRDENETSTLAYEKEKSDDIYGFGLVLVELLTSLKAEENVAKIFVRSVEGGTLRQTLDEEIMEERFDNEVITKAADLAKKCLNSRGEERPSISMKDVAREFQELTMAQHPSGGEEDDISPSPKDTGNLVDSSSAECGSSMKITPLGDGW